MSTLSTMHWACPIFTDERMQVAKPNNAMLLTVHFRGWAEVHACAGARQGPLSLTATI